jgi:hypothetical protein
MTLIKKIPFTFNQLSPEYFCDVVSGLVPNPVYLDLKIKQIPEVLIFSNGSVITREQANKIKVKTFFNYYDEYYTGTFLSKEKTPFMICFCDGSFTHLDSLKFEPLIISYLNKQGLKIFFWEMIILATNNEPCLEWPLNRSNYTSLEELVSKNKSSIVGFESNKDNLENLKCFDFNTIKKFAKNNNLNNITIYTGNYQNHKYFSKNYPEFKFEVRDLATASMFQETSKEKLTSYTYNSCILPTSDSKIKYKFWSSNRRYSGTRNIIAAYLQNRSALVSFDYYYIDFIYKLSKMPETENFWKNINNKLWFNLEAWKTTYPEIYNRLIPGMKYIDKEKYLSIDRSMDTVDDFMDDEIPMDHYYSCFCSVVTESEFAQPCGHYADKTLNAIKCFRPFILAAPPHTLEYLKEAGVKTFSDYWDESYDEEENHENRLIKILKLIDYIDSKPLEELKVMYNKMLPILNHNYRIIKNLKY